MDIEHVMIDNSINSSINSVSGYGNGGGSGLYQLKNEFNSFDSGFESILIRDDDSFSYKSSSNLSLSSIGSSSPSYFETPKKHDPQQQHSLRTPIKQHQIMITPNSSRKQQIADVDGIYLAFLKSPLKSPQTIIASNQDNYLRERDTFKTNLLRSPAFKHVASSQLIPPEPVKRIKCKQFTTIQPEDTPPQPLLVPPPPLPVPTSVQPSGPSRTTPTEDEFVELLFKNHLPKNPNCLIGRHMGVDQIDIINELNKRSMNNVIDIIMNNLNAIDYQTMFNVSKTWRYVIESDTNRNKSRIKYIKFRRKYIEATKENQTGLSPNFKKSTKFSPKKRLSNGAFTKLDINKLNNDAYNETTSIFIDKTICFERKLIINDYKQINEHQHKLTTNNWFLLEQNKAPDAVLNSPNDSMILNKTKNTTKIGSKTSKKNLKRL